MLLHFFFMLRFSGLLGCDTPFNETFLFYFCFGLLVAWPSFLAKIPKGGQTLCI